jgi:hypothetical protein
MLKAVEASTGRLISLPACTQFATICTMMLVHSLEIKGWCEECGGALTNIWLYLRRERKTVYEASDAGEKSDSPQGFNSINHLQQISNDQPSFKSHALMTAPAGGKLKMGTLTLALACCLIGLAWTLLNVLLR